MSLGDPQNRISAISYGLPIPKLAFPGESTDSRSHRQQLAYQYREILFPRPVTLLRAVVLLADSKRTQFGD